MFIPELLTRGIYQITIFMSWYYWKHNHELETSLGSFLFEQKYLSNILLACKSS